MKPLGLAPPFPQAGSLRSRALAWNAWLVLVLLWTSRAAFARELARVPDGMLIGTVVIHVIAALSVMALAFLVTAPFSLWPRLYTWIAPAWTAVACLIATLDAKLFDGTGFHLNGLILQVLLQPEALAGVGISRVEAALFLIAGAGLMAIAIGLGRAFLLTSRPLPGAGLFVAIVLVLEVFARTGAAVLAFEGGLALDAATSVLPLQPTVRLQRELAAWTGRKPLSMDTSSLSHPGEVGAGLAAKDVNVTRRPDVVFVLAESLRADFLDAETMPHLFARAASGVRFLRHYSTASSTQYAVFSLFFGMNAHRLESVLGAGQAPLFFPALTQHGYQPRVIAASTVDWMGMRDSVFADVKDALDIDIPGHGFEKDAVLMERAGRFIDGADERPLFLFVFFEGTHFNYTYPPDAERFTPCWDGRGTLEAAQVDPLLLRNRARNSAWHLDREVDALLEHVERVRGRKPLAFVTGDHAEEFRDQGRVGHSSDVNDAQIHVPMLLFDEGLAPGEVDVPTSHVDVLPTLLARLGDTHDPATYSDGVSMLAAPADRYVLSTVGWEPKFAAIGLDLKVRFYALDGGFGTVDVTDPSDRPIADGAARFARESPQILKALQRR